MLSGQVFSVLQHDKPRKQVNIERKMKVARFCIDQTSSKMRFFFSICLGTGKTQVNETHGHEVSLTPSLATPSGESSASRSLSTRDPSLGVSCRKILLLTCILCSADLLSTQLNSLVSRCSTNCGFPVMVSPRNCFHQVLEFATTTWFQWAATTRNPCVHSRYLSERDIFHKFFRMASLFSLFRLSRRCTCVADGKNVLAANTVPKLHTWDGKHHHQRTSSDHICTHDYGVMHDVCKRRGVHVQGDQNTQDDRKKPTRVQGGRVLSAMEPTLVHG